MSKGVFRFIMAALVMLASGGQAMGRDWTAVGIINAIEASGLADEIHAVMSLEAATEGYGLGLDERILITVPGGEELFGYDGSGGTYHLLADGRVLHIDSEGTAGVVARDFSMFLAIGTGLPGWKDALRFMGHPDIATVRAEWDGFAIKWNLEAQQDSAWPYYPELFVTATPREGRKAIAVQFGIEPLADPLATLFEAINTLNADVRVSWKGEVDYPLFGRQLSLD